MRIGLYGGSFDPVHHGHLLLAREAMERFALDEVRFIPAAQSPFKIGMKTAPAFLRAEMLRAAIAGEAGFVVDDRELHRPLPSYTIDTVESIAEEHPQAALFYFIGADHFATLHRWHRAEELKTKAQFIAFTRPGFSEESEVPSIARAFDISSTEIRNRVAKGLSIRYCVPDSVRELIAQHELYKENPLSNPNP